MQTTYLPLQQSERHEIYDLLRGVAILGILMVNMALMNAPFVTEMGKFALWTDLFNQRAAWFINFFFTGKFYPLFSMLFGIGFYYFMKKGTDSGGNILPLFRRRLGLLLAIGVLHVALLWYGDILVFYALAGFIMILFRNKSNRALLLWAVALLIAPLVLILFSVIMFNLALSMPESAPAFIESIEQQEIQMRELMDRAILAYSTGTFGEIFRMRIEEYLYVLSGIVFFLPTVLAMFLVGMLLARKRVFEAIDNNKRFFRLLFGISLPIALIGNLLLAENAKEASLLIMDWNIFLMYLGYLIGGPAMTFVYISTIVYCFHKGYFRKLTLALMAAGRMALTNYLMQSLIATTIFFSYGLGLYGKVNIWQGMMLTVLIFLVQLIISKIWLKHYRFGPVEWLWRTLTYGKRQPFKRDSNPIA